MRAIVGRRLWKNADKSFVEDRMSALLAIAQQLADLPKSSARFREKLAELADHVGSALSPDAQKELTERFAETTSTALRLATRLQTISKTGTQMSREKAAASALRLRWRCPCASSGVLAPFACDDAVRAPLQAYMHGSSHQSPRLALPARICLVNRASMTR